MDIYGFPEVYIDKITLENDESGNNIVDILLRMKISDNGEDLFSRNFRTNAGPDLIRQSFDSAVQVNIMQVTDENLFSILTLSTELVYAAAFDRFSEINVPLFIKRAMEIKGIIDTDVLTAQSTEEVNNSIRSSIGNMVEIQTITDFSLTNDFKRYKENLKTGEKALNIYFKKRFLLEKSPRHLSYFVIADYKEENYSQLEVNENVEDKKVSAELVINNNLIVSHTYSYFRENGEIWSGEMFRDPEGVWRIGKAEEYERAVNGTIEMPERLQQRTFYNNKIQDFRNIAEPTFLGINDKKVYLDDQATRQLEKNERRTYIKPRNIEPVVFAGKTGDGVAFKIDLERLLEKHSQFYRFLQSLDKYVMSYNRNIINDLKIYKKRIRRPIPIKGSAESNLQEQVEDFTENEKPVYIQRVYRSYNHMTDTVAVSAVDKDIMEHSAGSYCYGIELIFSDPFTSIFENRIKQLKAFLPLLIRYSADSTVLSYYRQDGTFVEGHYDPEMDQMTDKFKERYNPGTQDRYDLVRTTSSFLDYLSFINNIEMGRTATIKINEMVMPATASPKSILQFIKLYQDLIMKYEKIVKEMKPNTFYEEKIYFNKITNIISTAQQTLESAGYYSNTNSVEEEMYSNLKELSQFFSLSITRNEKNIVDSAVERRELILENDATPTFASEMKSIVDDAKVLSTPESNFNQIKTIISRYKSGISAKALSPIRKLDYFAVGIPVISKEKIEKEKRQLSKIATTKDIVEAMAIVDRSRQDTPDKDKTSNITIAKNSLLSLQQQIAKKTGFNLKNKRPIKKLPKKSKNKLPKKKRRRY